MAGGLLRSIFGRRRSHEPGSSSTDQSPASTKQPSDLSELPASRLGLPPLPVQQKKWETCSDNSASQATSSAQPSMRVPVRVGWDGRPLAGLPVPMEFTFEAGALGLMLYDTPTGPAIQRVAGQAEALGVPVGGRIISINGEAADGDKAAVKLQLASATRPLKLRVAAAPDIGDPLAQPGRPPSRQTSDRRKIDSETFRAKLQQHAPAPAGPVAATPAPNPFAPKPFGKRSAAASAPAINPFGQRPAAAGAARPAFAAAGGALPPPRPPSHRVPAAVPEIAPSPATAREGSITVFVVGSLGAGIATLEAGGIVVTSVEAGGAAALAGVKPNMLVAGFNGIDTSEMQKSELMDLVRAAQAAAGGVAARLSWVFAPAVGDFERATWRTPWGDYTPGAYAQTLRPERPSAVPSLRLPGPPAAARGGNVNAWRG